MYRLSLWALIVSSIAFAQGLPNTSSGQGLGAQTFASGACTVDVFGNINCQDAGWAGNEGIAGSIAVKGLVDAGTLFSSGSAGVNTFLNVGGLLDAGALAINTAASIGTGSVNFIQIKGAGSGSASQILIDPNSGDTNPNLSIAAKGTGSVRLGQNFNNYLQLSGTQSAGTAITFGNVCTDAACNFRLSPTGGAVGLPSIANASLLTCTASTWNATNVGAGAIDFDSTNNAMVECNGTRWVYLDLWKTCTMSTTSCTVAVPSGTSCVCMSSSATSSPLGSSCAVASTTATCTSTVSNTDVWNVVVH